MDVYVHPFTSGGQEIPIQEAKLTELITLVTNYSCGEEMCQPGAGSFILDWAEYREQGTQFRKASTYPSSIAKQLTKVYEMKYEDRRKIGKQAREWVINNFSMEQIGKQIETFIDNCPDINFDPKELNLDREMVVL
jgi:glycosyltransferase involved in cell wall biosynthesis